MGEEGGGDGGVKKKVKPYTGDSQLNLNPLSPN